MVGDWLLRMGCPDGGVAILLLRMGYPDGGVAILLLGMGCLDNRGWVFILLSWFIFCWVIF